MEFVPLALACGHLVRGSACFRWSFPTGEEVDEIGVAAPPAGARHSQIACPEGCGWQDWVAEPAPADGRVGRALEDAAVGETVTVALGDDEAIFRALFGDLDDGVGWPSPE